MNNRIGSPKYLKELKAMLSELGDISPAQRFEIVSQIQKIERFLSPSIDEVSSLMRENNRLRRKSEYYRKIATKHSPREVLPFEIVDDAEYGQDNDQNYINNCTTP